MQQSESFHIMAAYGHALTMAGQFMIFCWNVSPVNEQKAEFYSVAQ
jgi:hypothetical protein